MNDHRHYTVPELQRLVLYGTCPKDSTPLDVRVERAGTDRCLVLYCPGCEGREGKEGDPR